MILNRARTRLSIAAARSAPILDYRRDPLAGQCGSSNRVTGLASGLHCVGVAAGWSTSVGSAAPGAVYALDRARELIWGTGFTLVGFAAGTGYSAVSQVAGRASTVLLVLIVVAVGAHHLRRRRRRREGRQAVAERPPPA